MVKVLESPFYYLDNFHRALEWIRERYCDLLTDDELLFITHFCALPLASRGLFVRIVMRKGELFRASKLVYAEIGCTDQAARPLHDIGWIERNPLLSLDELFGVLKKPEIEKIFGLSLHEKKARKSQQLEALHANYNETRHFSSWHGDSGESVFRMLVKPLCERLRLIFFGNLRQDWSEFVLSELGVHKYEKVDFSLSSRGFRTRRDIDDYLALQRWGGLLEAHGPNPELVAALSGNGQESDWIRSRRAKLLFQVGQYYERQNHWASAFDSYARCMYPGSRVRAIRVLEKSGDVERAHALLTAAQTVPDSELEAQQLSRIAPRLRRKLGHPKLMVSRAVAVARFKVALPLPPAPWLVEAVVRDHLARADAPVYYVENALINGLFGLLCWDAIFCAIPGAFFHPFQRGPADLFSPDFLRRRLSEFNACMSELNSGQYVNTIRRNFSAKYGTQSPFLIWECLAEELIDLALECIPAAHLKQWFERILLDIKSNRSGFPDLIQFWPAEKRYNMIEVKGPGDRLQDNQVRWINFCTVHHMPISVCYVQWVGHLDGG